MRPKALNRLLETGGIGIALLGLVVIFSLLAPQFASSQNIRNILGQITVNSILAIGMTFVILVAGIDLSVGSVMAFSMMVGAVVMSSGSLSPVIMIILGIVTSLGVGVGVGLANGWISERWRLPSFIVTLGMLNVARGAALMTTDARSIYDFPRVLTKFGSSTSFGKTFPSIFLVALVLAVISVFVLQRTVFGRMIYAIGTNEEAVRLSGHNPATYKIAAFAISGFTAALAGIINLSRLTIASPSVGGGFELNAIAAVIIGGTSLFGGKGTVIGTILGACIIGVLSNGLVLLGVQDFLRQMITGFVIILAVILDYYRGRLAERSA